MSTFHGGFELGTVPECAMFVIGRRLGPEERPSDAYGELIGGIAANAEFGRCRIEHERPFLESCGLDDKFNRDVGQRIARLVSDNHVGCELSGVPYGADAPAISNKGVPTVVFVPGSIDEAHAADEFITIEDLELGAESLFQIARKRRE